MICLPKSGIKGIKLEQCSLLFLATPHSGTTRADWSNLLVALAGTLASVRKDTIESLESFNRMSLSDKQEFLTLTPCPLFRCLAEGEMITIKGMRQQVSALHAMAIFYSC
jgi:hypothetical protein